MSSKQIKELLKIMDTNDLVELELQEADFRIKLRKREEHAVREVRAKAASVEPITAQPIVAKDDAKYFEVKSPMVGTFYRSAGPDSPVFVEKGTEIKADTVICIIEAMKVMNEIKAGTSGRIVDVLVENAQPVEYGQVLFRVLPG